MKRWLSGYRNKEQVYKQYSIDNQDAIDKFNQKALATLLSIGWVLTLLPLAAVPFSDTKINAIPAYLATFSAYFILFLLFRIPAIRKHSLVGLYISFSILFIFGIYLSSFHSPNMRATILLGGFILMPISFIDKFRRIRVVLVFWLVVSTVIAFYQKPQYALDDAINCLSSAVLGYYVGKMMIHVRLESFEASRQLVIEKETDVLTGLLNRRKLFETLAQLETTDSEKPSGILMIDIDHFKKFNDNYGHIAGDKYLSHLGETLLCFAQNFRLQFYRYGGEEFVAMAYGYDAKELMSIAESLRISILRTDELEQHTTVSIGVAYCGDELVKNYENVIDRADKATYAAKKAGRNKVCIEQR